MCVPIVKPRWRVRHWSAPDRIQSSPSSDVSFNGNSDEIATTEEDPTTVNDIADQSNMIGDLYLFPSDTEDCINEITSSKINFSKPFKGDDMVNLICPFFTNLGRDGFARIGNSVMELNDKGFETRSLATCSNDGMSKNGKGDTEACKEEFTLAQEFPKKEVYLIPGTRQCHASYPSSLQDDRHNSSRGDVCLAALSKPSLPAQSIPLMLLLQCRQKLKEASLGCNTARRNLSTARTTTILKRTTIRAPRYYRQLQKLKLLFPHHHQDSACKKGKYSHRSSLVKCVYPFYDSPMAHDLQVPDHNKLIDLNHCPIQNNLKNSSSKLKDEDPIFEHARTDKHYKPESSNDLKKNCQNISKNIKPYVEPTLVQRSLARPVPNLSCNKSKDSKTSDRMVLSLRANQVLNRSTRVNRKHVFRNLIYNAYGGAELGNNPEANGQTQSRLPIQPHVDVDNSRSLEHQVSPNSLPNQTRQWYNEYFGCPFMSHQTQYNINSSCCIEDNRTNDNLTLPNTTSSSFSFTQDVNLIKKSKNVSFQTSRNDGMCTLKPTDHFLCHIKELEEKDEKLGFERNHSELNGENVNDYYDMNSALLTSSSALKDFKSPINKSNSLSSTLLSPALHCQNENMVPSSQNEFVSSAPPRKAQWTRCLTRTNFPQKTSHRYWRNPIIVALMMILMITISCAQETKMKKSGKLTLYK